eukprot:gene32992-40721_t
MVNEQGVCAGINRRLDQCEACRDAANQLADLVAALDLQTIRPIILEASDLKQCAEVAVELWLIFAQATTVALAVLFVIATLKPDWLRRPELKPLRQSLGASAPLKLTSNPPREASASREDGHGLRAAARNAAPAVVTIMASKAPARDNDRLGGHIVSGHVDGVGLRGEVQRAPQVGLGSGVIVTADGYLLTNNHVVEGASDIEVRLNDGRQAKAELVGTDPETDLAVLRVGLRDLPVIEFGRIEELAVGDTVLAIGNPFNVGQTVTSGIVSAMGRKELGINIFENFIQTDAAINPGNSGGALVDADGALVGISTAIYSRSGGSLGIGFAIPVSTARQVMESLVRDGQVARGWIGVQTRELNEEFIEAFKLKVREGVLVSGVLLNAPAEKAGIKPGDVVTRVAGTPVRSPGELLTAVAALAPKSKAQISVQRGDKALQIELLVQQRPRPPAKE